MGPGPVPCGFRLIRLGKGGISSGGLVAVQSQHRCTRPFAATMVRARTTSPVGEGALP